MADQKKRVVVLFPLDLFDELSDLAEYRTVTPSAIIREAVVVFLETHPAPARADDDRRAA